MIERVEDENREEKYRKVSDDVLKKISSFYQNHPDILRDVEPTEGRQTPVPEKKPKIPVEQVVRKQRENREQERRKQPSASKSDSKKPEQPRMGKLSRLPGSTLSIEFVLPQEEHGINWHSHREGSVVQVNVQNSDFGFAERLGMSRLKDYIFLLLQKELTCASLESSSARLFTDRFEDTFMALYRAGLG